MPSVTPRCSRELGTLKEWTQSTLSRSLRTRTRLPKPLKSISATQVISRSLVRAAATDCTCSVASEGNSELCAGQNNLVHSRYSPVTASNQPVFEVTICVTDIAQRHCCPDGARRNCYALTISRRFVTIEGIVWKGFQIVVSGIALAPNKRANETLLVRRRPILVSASISQPWFSVLMWIDCSKQKRRYTSSSRSFSTKPFVLGDANAHCAAFLFCPFHCLPCDVF
jgi:hypothetical protein